MLRYNADARHCSFFERGVPVVYTKQTPLAVSAVYALYRQISHLSAPSPHCLFVIPQILGDMWRNNQDLSTGGRENLWATLKLPPEYFSFYLPYMVSCTSPLSNVCFTRSSSASTTALLVLGFTHSIKTSCSTTLPALYRFTDDRWWVTSRRIHNKTFDFPCACTPFVTDLPTYTTVQINTGLTTSSFDWMGLFFRFFHRKSMSSSDSLVTSHGVHDKHLVLIIWSRICSCMAAASPNGKVWPLSQFSYKLFDGFVSQLICFTKMKPSIRNIRLLFELLIQGCFCFLIYLFGQREISILNV